MGGGGVSSNSEGKSVGPFSAYKKTNDDMRIRKKRKCRIHDGGKREPSSGHWQTRTKKGCQLQTNRQRGLLFTNTVEPGKI